MADLENSSAVLDDVSNARGRVLNKINDTPSKAKVMSPEEASTNPRAKGWVEPKGYDYSKYLATESLPTASDNAGQNDLPEWAGKAAKYEWNAEYGDIGPPNPELEKMLFHNELINRTGLKIAK